MDVRGIFRQKKGQHLTSFFWWFSLFLLDVRGKYDVREMSAEFFGCMSLWPFGCSIWLGGFAVFVLPLLAAWGCSYHGASFAFPLQMVRRNQIVRLNKDSAVKILCGIHAAGSLLVHEGWKGTDCARNSPIAHWHAKVDAIACIHAENIAIYGLPLCHRANDNGSVSFIEWAKNCPQQ